MKKQGVTYISVGQKQFKQFLGREGIKNVAAAKALHCDPSLITLWLKHGTTPEIGMRRAIAVYTKGEVKESEWETATERALVKSVKPFDANEAE